MSQQRFSSFSSSRTPSHHKRTYRSFKHVLQAVLNLHFTICVAKELGFMLYQLVLTFNSHGKCYVPSNEAKS